MSPNRSPRTGKVRLFIVHHYAGTQDPESAWKRFMNANDRSVSPNYQVNADGSVFEVVPPDEFRAWTTGVIDHQAVTCETQNTSGAPDWGVSKASHEAIAHLIAWAAQRYGFPIQRGEVAAGNVVTVPGVVGHRETPAGKQTSTSCPGPSMDLDWLVKRAQEIAAGKPAGDDDTDKEEEHDMSRVIGGPGGAQKIIDEMGADDIGDFFFVSPDFSWTDNILATWKLTGIDHEKGETPENATNWKEFELVRHIANSRWDRKRGQIVTDVVASLTPLLEKIGAAVAGLSPESIREAIDAGLADVVVKAEPLSAADLEAIAKASADEQAKRLAPDAE